MLSLLGKLLLKRLLCGRVALGERVHNVLPDLGKDVDKFVPSNIR